MVANNQRWLVMEEERLLLDAMDFLDMEGKSLLSSTFPVSEVTELPLNPSCFS